jgi:1-acyl-sn-glycerol-3-phosphate acyltransferase
LQNFISLPIKYGYSKIKLRTRYVGKEKLKPYKKQGYFIYSNHTQNFADTFLTSNAIYPKRNFFIVNPENVSMKFLGNSIQMLGAIPIPTERKAMKNFVDAVNQKIKKGYSVTIFPEAHIWPFYTKIRPFKAVSFRYPVELDVPTFCITNTYQFDGKRGFKLISYIDGPFFASDDLSSIQEKKQDLRNQVYNCMVERSKNSNFEYVKYRKNSNL